MNCSQTGIGKTFSTLTAAVHKIIERWNDDIHFILLLPLPAVKAFEDELNNLQLPYNIYTANKSRVLLNARFHIFNYSTLPKDVIQKNKRGQVVGVGTNKYFETFKELRQKHPNLWLVADEAHVLQDPNTIQYSFVKEIMPLFIGAWFLTATPILNDSEGLFHMTDLLVPGFWGNIYQFKNKYQILEERIIWKWNPRLRQRTAQRTMDVVGFKNLDHMAHKFNEIAIIRAQHYDLTFLYKTAVLSPESERFYKLAADGLFSGKAGNNNKKKSTHGARLHDLQRVVSNSHKDFKQFSDDIITEKEELLLNTIKDIASAEEAQLIYFSYRETLDRVKTLLQKVKSYCNINNIYEIHGDISQKKRKLVESKLGARDVVLMTSAGTESINLQKANNLVFYEIPFALRQFIQACGRITRVNSTYNDFKVYVLEAENTIDTYKKNRIVANSELIKYILGGSNALPTDLLQVSLDDVNAMKDELLWRK